MQILERTQWIPIEKSKLWEFFSAPQNLNLMTPSFLDFKIISQNIEPMFEGQIIEYSVKFDALLPRNYWLTEITHCKPNDFFVDEQRLGPYRLWHHLHRFEEMQKNGQMGTLMIDRVHYQMPFEPISKFFLGQWVAGKLKRIFDYRGQYMQKQFGADPAR